MNTLEDEIIDAAGSRMAAEIDFEILSNMLIELGWTKVILKPMTWEDGLLIDHWVAQNTKGHYQTMGLVWLFEYEHDANWFKLRWL